ncbi:AMP-binding protein [Caviibacter abscessus]|uniref:AMP-binding protein n=1 Tax=Caviibacter abscessus TaxID=1766719 RepID=UPI0008303CB3|nr:AMP-binding protein [Caviibacter abscessus]
MLKYSNLTALIDSNSNKITYATLIKHINSFSDKYLSDVKKGDFVLICSENRVEWIYSLYAIWNRGAIAVPVDYLSTKDEIDFFMNDLKTDKIIVSNKTKNNVENYTVNIDEIKLDESSQETKTNTPNGDDLAIIMYTSGTTGNPKGVMLTANNLLGEIDSIIDLKVVPNSPKTIAVLPFHHILPLMTTMIFFLNNQVEGTVILVDKLTGDDILKACKHGIDILVLVPRVYELFYNSIKNKIFGNIITKTLFNIVKLIGSKKLAKLVFKKVHNTLGNVKTLACGGAKADVKMMDFFTTLGFMFFEGYGLTETTALFAASINDHCKHGTVGKGIKNTSITIRDNELLVKGPMVTKGYYNNPEKTKEAFTEDGWFKTGDLVELDENGYIKIVGRANAMIVLSNGKNIDPEDIEQKIMRINDGTIKEIAVLAYNNKLCAVAVSDKSLPYIKKIIEKYNNECKPHLRILDVKTQTTELPRTRIGKLRRFVLKDIYSKDNSDIEIKENISYFKEYDEINKYIYEAKGFYVKPNFSLELDYGLDSLDLIELKTFIEKSFGVKSKGNTLEEIATYVKDNSKGYNKTNTSIENTIKNAPVKEYISGFLVPIAKFISYILCKIYFRLKIKNKVDEKGVKIYIANHESFIDAFALMNMVENNTYFLGIDWYFNNKFLRWVAKNSNIVLLNIDENMNGTIETLASILKSGKNVFIFPEGERTRNGNLGEFKKTYAMLSKNLNVPISCLKISGAYEAMPFGSKFIKPVKVTTQYLGTVHPDSLTVDEIVTKTKNLYY